MTSKLDAYYAGVADKRERDPIVIPGEHGRADVASGRMSRWERFNKASDLIYVTTPEGNAVALTRKQVEVLYGVRRLAGSGVRVPMRTLARHLSVAPSTVSRAAVKLTAFGFIAYQSNRGRYGGTVFVLRRGLDGLDWCRDAAKATVRRWAKAAAERVSRLISNVAPYHPGRESELVPSTYTLERNIRKVSAEWTPDDLREAGII